MIKALFICKQTEEYSQQLAYSRKYSGLYNSARLMVDMLNGMGIAANLDIAIDNNCIDRLVTEHKPTHVFIEAYWVVPSKFEILSKLHPNVTWVIRVHSEIPFWATEGIAMKWTLEYLDYPNTIIAPNSTSTYHDIHTVLSTKYIGNISRVAYLPNYYPIDMSKTYPSPAKVADEYHIGCFGAIRPLKNQLMQAIAAIRYCDVKDRCLYFHINSGRVEGNGYPILENIRELFANSHKHVLVEHPWIPHEDFLALVAKMDIGMQVSFSESFNIVTADFVAVGRPVVVSNEIDWVARKFFASPTHSVDIMKAMYRAEAQSVFGTSLNRYLLEEYSLEASERWFDFLMYQKG